MVWKLQLLIVNYLYYFHPLYQVSQCQVLLDVQLLGFQNANNLETRYSNTGDVQYCCCDNTNCSLDKSASNIESCPSLSCDIFFNMKLSGCQYPSVCSMSTFDQPITDSPSVLSSAHRFCFILNNIPPQVSHIVNLFWRQHLKNVCCTWLA